MGVFTGEIPCLETKAGRGGSLGLGPDFEATFEVGRPGPSTRSGRGIRLEIGLRDSGRGYRDGSIL